MNNNLNNNLNNIDRKKKKSRFILQKIFWFIQLLASVGLILVLGISNLFPAKYIILAGAVLAFLLLIVYLFTIVVRSRKNKDGKRKHIRRKIGYLMSLITVITCVVGIYMMAKLMGTLSGISGGDIENDNRISSITSEPFIVYISGNDARTTDLSKGRSDVNILAVVNPKTKKVLLVNTPRDYYVEVSIAPGNYDKLTHCGIHGIQCSMDTLANLYDCKINYYAQINFNGFRTLVDSVGGVNVNIEKSFTSSKASSPERKVYDFTEGQMELDGAKALVYARERKAFPDGDLARGRHQMAVIEGLINKMSSGAIITHYSEIMDSIKDMCATSVSSSEMSDLVKMQFKEGSKWDVTSYAVTGGNAKKTTYSSPNSKRYVMTQDPEKIAEAKALINEVLSGE